MPAFAKTNLFPRWNKFYVNLFFHFIIAWFIFLSFFLVWEKGEVLAAGTSGPLGSFSSAFTPEHVDVEQYFSTNQVLCLAYSDDRRFIWAGTRNGLEKREAATGRLLRVYTEADGLPDNGIGDVVADGSGGLWLAAYSKRGGLGHLTADGACKVYDTGNSPIPNNQVVSLAVDGSGGVWAGVLSLVFYGALGHLAPDGTWQVYTSKVLGQTDPLKIGIVRALVPDGFGGLWVSAWQTGLARLKADGTWVKFDTDNSRLPDNCVASIALDGTGGVWVGTESGNLAHLSAAGAWEVYNEENSCLSGAWIGDLVLDGSGGVWVGTWENGLIHMTPGGACQAWRTDNSELPDNSIGGLLTDDSGGLWVGTQGGGLAHMGANGDWETCGRDSSARSSHKISALGINDDGVWVGTTNGLLLLEDDGTWQWFYTNHSNLPAMYISALSPNGSDPVWMGTGNGALGYYWQEGLFGSRLPRTTGITEDEVRFVVPDKSGMIWAGTDGGASGQGVLAHEIGEFSWEPWEILTGDDFGVGPVRFLSLILDNEDGVWIGTSNGLVHRPASGQVQVFTFDDGAFANWFTALALDGTGGLWAGTLGCGLRHLTAGGSWEKWTKENSGLPGNRVLELVPDGLGGLWIGTHEGGVAHRSVRGVWQVYNKDNAGLSGNYITALTSDNAGGAWAGVKDPNGLAPDLVHLIYNGRAADTPQAPSGNLFNMGDPPMVSRLVYSQDDPLRITLPLIPAGKDTYVAVALPNGGVFFLTGTNTLGPGGGKDFTPWTGGLLAVDTPIATHFQKGEYMVYLLRVPEGIHPQGSLSDWELGWAGFEIQ